MLRSRLLLEFDTHGILPTPQRLEIAEILFEKPQHLSAEQIIDRLRQKDSGVSKATVYNTLNLFSERGLIKDVLVDPTRRFFDSSTHPHHHFYNLDTGELTDVGDGAVVVSQLPVLPPGTTTAGVEVLIKVRNIAD